MDRAPDLKIVTGSGYPVAPFPELWTTGSFPHGTSTQVETPQSPRSRRNYITETGPGFSDTSCLNRVILQNTGQQVNIEMSAKIDKGFFLAEQYWSCYRRNYFQLSTAFRCFVPSKTNHLDGSKTEVYPKSEVLQLYDITDDKWYRINSFSVGLTASNFESKSEIELVKNTSKRDKGPQNAPEKAEISAGGVVPGLPQPHLLPSFAFSSIQPGDSSRVPDNCLVTFERIQFKTATANNGKRVSNQQFYQIELTLYGSVWKNDRFEDIPVGKIATGPLVVRGRSPRHYSNVGISDLNFSHQRTPNTLKSPLSAGLIPFRRDSISRSYHPYAMAQSQQLQVTPQKSAKTMQNLIQNIPQLTGSSNSSSEFPLLSSCDLDSLRLNSPTSKSAESESHSPLRAQSAGISSNEPLFISQKDHEIEEVELLRKSSASVDLNTLENTAPSDLGEFGFEKLMDTFELGFSGFDFLENKSD